VLTLATSVRAVASEYGISTYRPGLMDLFAGYMAPPGTTVVKNYFLFQDARADALTANGFIQAHTHTVTYTAATFAAYVTPWRILGSNWAFGAIAQTRLADQSLRVGPAGHLSHQTSTVAGFGDLIFSPCLLSWSFGRFHLMSSLMFYAPTGGYDRHRIINIGTNRWAVEPDLGVTWMNEETGRHFSAFLGYTINTANTETHYRSGDEFHVDFVTAQHLRNGLVLGMAGYALQQVTPDSGTGDAFGAFEGRVIALGPLVGATVKIGKLPINFCFKYDFEFAARNLSTGNELWLTAAYRF
jgi:hypothetical protein